MSTTFGHNYIGIYGFAYKDNKNKEKNETFNIN